MSAFGFAVLTATAAAVAFAVRSARINPPDYPGDAASTAPEVPDVAREAEIWLRQQTPPGH